MSSHSVAFEELLQPGETQNKPHFLHTENTALLKKKKKVLFKRISANEFSKHHKDASQPVPHSILLVNQSNLHSHPLSFK